MQEWQGCLTNPSTPHLMQPNVITVQRLTLCLQASRLPK